MNKIYEISQESDLPPMTISMPSINGNSLDPKGVSWKLDMYTANNRMVEIKYDTITKTISNIGIIPANVSIEGSNIKLFVESSEVHFSRGQLKILMTLYVPDSNYKDGTIKLKTKEKVLNIRIV